MKKLLMTGAAIAALSTAASASTFTLIGGSLGAIPQGATNEVLTQVFGMGGAGGTYGAQVSLDSAATITVDMMGYEAAFVNSFSFGGVTTDTEVGGLEVGVNGLGNSEYATAPNTPILSYQVAAGAGVLSFSFSTSGGGGVPADTVDNSIAGDNPDDNGGAAGAAANFFVSYGQGDPSTVYLWFDDGGGGNDDNHDDFVVRLTTNSNPPGPQPVPLPATGLLLLGALGGIAAAKRRSK